MNHIEVRRLSAADHFTTIPNDVIRSADLSYEAVGLLVYLLSHVDGWVTSKVRLGKAKGVGKDKIKRILDELESARYLDREEKRDENGKYAGMTYIVSDCPMRRAPEVGNPVSENPPPVNPPTLEEQPLRTPSFKEDPPYMSPPVEIGPDSLGPIAFMQETYNAVACEIGIPQCRAINEKRRRSAMARWKECGGEEGWKHAMEQLASSAFLRGQNDRGWRADFDFVIQPKSFTRLMEGFYEQTGNSRRSEFDAALAALAASDNGSGLSGEGEGSGPEDGQGRSGPSGAVVGSPPDGASARNWPAVSRDAAGYPSKLPPNG